MDLSSAFRSEVFRPMVTLVVPGSIAAAPYVLIARHYNADIGTFLDQHAAIGGIVLAIIAVGAGMVIEDFGSLIETAWDRQLEPDAAARQANWYGYLTMRFEPEPVGQRYLRTILLRLKFELSMVIAIPVMLAGWTWIEMYARMWRGPSFAVPVLLGLFLTGYLLWESKQSIRVLTDLRAHLIDAAPKMAAPAA